MQSAASKVDGTNVLTVKAHNFHVPLNVQTFEHVSPPLTTNGKRSEGEEGSRRCWTRTPKPSLERQITRQRWIRPCGEMRRINSFGIVLDSTPTILAPVFEKLRTTQGWA